MYEAVSKLLKLSLESFMAQDGVNTQEDKLAEIAALEASIDKMELPLPEASYQTSCQR